MKVVSFNELCQEPNGAIFSTYDPCIVECLYRRGRPYLAPESMRDYYGVYSDFLYHDLLAAPDTNVFSDDLKAQAFRNIEYGSRCGNFDPDELFILYDKQDITKLVGMLTGTTRVEDE